MTLLASYAASHADAALPFTSAKLGALLVNILENTYEALPSVRPAFLSQSTSTLTDTLSMTRRSAASSSSAVTISKENGMRCVSFFNLEMATARPEFRLPLLLWSARGQGCAPVISFKNSVFLWRGNIKLSFH